MTLGGTLFAVREGWAWPGQAANCTLVAASTCQSQFCCFCLQRRVPSFRLNEEGGGISHCSC